MSHIKMMICLVEYHNTWGHNYMQSTVLNCMMQHLSWKVFNYLTIQEMLFMYGNHKNLTLVTIPSHLNVLVVHTFMLFLQSKR